MPQFEHHFTVEEANAALESVRPLILEIQRLRDRAVVEATPAAPVLKLRRQNGGGAAANAFLAALNDLNREIERLWNQGIHLKDLEKGLVDFPAILDGREVYLCWHLGEEKVEYWHELDSGFAGRRPLGDAWIR